MAQPKKKIIFLKIVLDLPKNLLVSKKIFIYDTKDP
jgi:hypothetical protein